MVDIKKVASDLLRRVDTKISKFSNEMTKNLPKPSPQGIAVRPAVAANVSSTRASQAPQAPAAALLPAGSNVFDVKTRNDALFNKNMVGPQIKKAIESNQSTSLAQIDRLLAQNGLQNSALITPEYKQKLANMHSMAQWADKNNFSTSISTPTNNKINDFLNLVKGIEQAKAQKPDAGQNAIERAVAELNNTEAYKPEEKVAQAIKEIDAYKSDFTSA